MKDILLNDEHDIYIDNTGDIRLTDSVRQAVKIRLLWILGEWKFAPSFGAPYFSEILVKAPSIERIKHILHDEAVSVAEVIDVKNINVVIDKRTRTAKATLDIITTEQTYREEVLICQTHTA